MTPIKSKASLLVVGGAVVAAFDDYRIDLLGYDIAGLVPLGCDGDYDCLLYTSPSPRDYAASRMPSSA